MQTLMALLALFSMKIDLVAFTGLLRPTKKSRKRRLIHIIPNKNLNRRGQYQQLSGKLGSRRTTKMIIDGNGNLPKAFQIPRHPRQIVLSEIENAVIGTLR